MSETIKEIGKYYITKIIKQEVGEFNYISDDKEKYMEKVMDFLYEEFVDELIYEDLYNYLNK